VPSPPGLQTRQNNPLLRRTFRSPLRCSPNRSTSQSVDCSPNEPVCHFQASRSVLSSRSHLKGSICNRQNSKHCSFSCMPSPSPPFRRAWKAPKRSAPTLVQSSDPTSVQNGNPAGTRQSRLAALSRVEQTPLQSKLQLSQQTGVPALQYSLYQGELRSLTLKIGVVPGLGTLILLPWPDNDSCQFCRSPGLGLIGSIVTLKYYTKASLLYYTKARDLYFTILKRKATSGLSDTWVTLYYPT
jgi:hypothetical protein